MAFFFTNIDDIIQLISSGFSNLSAYSYISLYIDHVNLTQIVKGCQFIVPYLFIMNFSIRLFRKKNSTNTTSEIILQFCIIFLQLEKFFQNTINIENSIEDPFVKDLKIVILTFLSLEIICYNFDFK